MYKFYLSLFTLMCLPLARLAADEPAGTGSSWGAFLPLIAIVAIFYLLILRPQSKKQKETQKMLGALKKGDKVVTIGGIHGTIQTVRDNSLIIKVDDNVKLEFSRSAVASIETPAKEDKEDKKIEASSDENESENKE